MGTHRQLRPAEPLPSNPDRRRLRRWVRGLARARPGAAATAVAALVAAAVADALGVPDAAPHPGAGAPARPLGPAERPEPTWCSPHLPGLVYELLGEPGDRRQRGAWFTPPPVVDRLVDLALAEGHEPRQVLDPACGGGAFLLGVADALHRRGVAPDEVLDRLAGVDVDPGAVAVCRWSLDLWAAAAGAVSGGGRLTCVDFLHAPVLPGVDAVDLVVGNPPFATPLRAEHRASPAQRYREARPHLGPYVDAAACFLDRAAELVADGGRLVLVLPQSLLSGRDAAGLRERLSVGWELRQLWMPTETVFTASVHVFAPVLQRGGGGGEAAGRARPVELYGGVGVGRVGRAPAGSTWAEAAADAVGLPPVPAGQSAVLASVAEASSGFRDEFYGLARACREGGQRRGGLPVVTVGQIDALRWRRDRPIRFGGRTWEDPVVDPDRLEAGVASWVERQRRPKVLLATQTRVLEPLVDRTGRLVPATPVVAVHADPEALDRVAAVLLAPPVSVLAARRSVGTALHPGAIKMAARQVLDLPLPDDVGAWDEAASLLAEVDADRPGSPQLLWDVATLMCRAYGVEVEPLRRWWWDRLPGVEEVPPSRGGPTGRVGP